MDASDLTVEQVDSTGVETTYSVEHGDALVGTIVIATNETGFAPDLRETFTVVAIFKDGARFSHPDYGDRDTALEHGKQYIVNRLTE